MTSKIVVNNIEADSGISTVTFASEVTAPTFNGNIVGTAATFSGNVDIAGALTYEDVTNVDSVGIITARSGIHVTGGSVGIGTDNPTETLTLNHANGANIGLEYNGTENGTINVNSAAMYVRAGTGKHLILGSNGTEKVRVTSDGKFGVGLNPSMFFEVYSQSENDIARFSGPNSGNIVFRNDTSNEIQIHTGTSDALIFGTNGENERLRIGSGGGHKITCAEGYYAANLTECNDGRIALNINQTRQGQTKAIAIGAISGNSATGIQCYDTSNNSANNLILNPFGGNMGLGTNNPTSDGGTTFEIYDDNTPSIRLNDGGAYKALFQLRGNDLEIRGSNGQLEFYTGNADGASSSLRGAITSAGHKWTHNGSIFHGSNDVTDFTQSSRDSYNNISIRAGRQNAGTSPTNDNSAIKIYPAGVRSSTTGNLTGGIAWQHLDPNNGAWASTYGAGAQIWMGASLHDTPGQERDRFNLWMNSQTSGGSQPNNLAIEAYPNGVVRHPKVPAFMVRHTTGSGWAAANSVATWNTIILNNGNHWDSSNNRWTAPVDGIYHFTSQILSENNSRAFHHLRLNGVRVDGTRTESYQGTSYQTVTFVATINLSANDNVDVYIGTNGAYGSIYANFNGFLVG